MKRYLIAGIAGLAMAGTVVAPAFATSIVLGESRGASCYQSAKFGRSSNEDVNVCDLALTQDALTRKERAATHVNRGILHMQRHEYENAMNDFDTALKYNPRLGEAFANRGATLIHMGQYDRAIMELDKALKYSLDQPARTYFNRAVAHEELNDMRSAYRDYRKAAELMPAWNQPKMELTRFRVER